MITGLSHISLPVSNLQVSIDFYARVLGFILLARNDKQALFALPGQSQASIALDQTTRTIVPDRKLHVAFQVSSLEAMGRMLQGFIAADIKVIQSERTPRDGAYFLDPDGHKLELYCGTLEKMCLEVGRVN